MANKFKVEIQETVEELEHRLERAIAILNDFLYISVLMNFGKIKFMFLSEELKQKWFYRT